MVKVSIIIVNCNGKKYLYNCIKSIEPAIRSFKRRIEVLIFDNASTDNSMQLVEKHFSKYIKNHTIKTIKSPINHGPAYARNIAARYAKGKYLNFLDNDTVVEKNWIKAAIKCFIIDKKIAIIQCKLLLNKNKKIIDYVGEYLGTNGFLIQKAVGGERDRGQYETREMIMAAKSAGMFIRRDVFNKVGGFDDDYFIYLEETDLGMRVGLAGYKSIYCPKSIVYHESGGSVISLGSKQVSFNSKFHGTKNYIMTLIKTLEVRNLATILPLHILLWLGLAAFKLVTLRLREAMWILAGICWNVMNILKILNKRRRVQKLRKVSDKALFIIWIKKVPFSYFFNKAVVKKKIGNANSF